MYTHISIYIIEIYMYKIFSVALVYPNECGVLHTVMFNKFLKI